MAKPNYLSTMKNFALQQPSEDWMILEFSQLGFIGRLCWAHQPYDNPKVQPVPFHPPSFSPSTLLASLAAGALCLRAFQGPQPCPVFLGPHVPKVCPQGLL